MDQRGASRFALVTAAHTLVMRILPFRDPQSNDELAAFMAVAAAIPHLSAADIDAVLLRTLSVLDAHTGGRIPTLVERYLSHDDDDRRRIAKFAKCVNEVLKYRGIHNPAVQEIIAAIDERYHEPSLSVKNLAAAVAMRPTAVALLFEKHAGVSVTCPQFPLHG